MFKKNDLVQFNENHKWRGCIGIINMAEQCEKDVKYLIGVPVPEQGTAYIFSMELKKEFELVGRALFVPYERDEG